MRKCLVQDNDSHWYAIDVDKKDLFERLGDRMARYDEDDDKYWEALSEFENEFDADVLDMHISSYSFEDLQEIN